MKQVLISVYDKSGIVPFAHFLVEKGYKIISTGGTKKHLNQAGISVTDIQELTGYHEMLGGRMKTLHPKIHAGILVRRDMQEQMEVIASYNISAIDMVVVNLYPFFAKLHYDVSFDEKMEFIDIGGPTMLRSAAKNFKDVIVVTDIDDYDDVMKELTERDDVSMDRRKFLAGKVFNLTSAYDAAISEFLLGADTYPDYFTTAYKKKMELHYGENPHQQAGFYTSITRSGAMRSFNQLSGKPLSYNNIADMDVAWKVVHEFKELTCCGVKHRTPCAVAVGRTPEDAWQRMFACDSISIYGGVVAFNQLVDSKAAKAMSDVFLDVIIAPDFTNDALPILEKKKNLRVIKATEKPADVLDYTKVDGGILVQGADNQFVHCNEFKYPTKRKPTEDELQNLIFGMKVVKHVKSNGIVVIKDKAATGIGTGETNRIWAACHAIKRAGDGWVMASDAFFPFDDVVELCAKHNITAVIQPGGSIRDKDSIKKANLHHIAMVFTGMRHFKH